jgi:hypothetical protein
MDRNCLLFFGIFVILYYTYNNVKLCLYITFLKGKEYDV